MKIKINKIENKKDYFDEFYYIMSCYKRIYKNPNKKIHKKTTALLSAIIFILLYLIAVAVLAVIEKSMIYYICLGVSIVCLLLMLTRFISINTSLKKYCNNEKYDSELDIDEERIVLNNKKVDQETTIKWKDLERILVTKRCILFMKKINKETPDVAIITPRFIEGDVIKALEKYDKKDYLMYNKKDM